MDYSGQTNNSGAGPEIKVQGIEMKAPKSIDELSINTIRFLSVDAVQKAKSGHPGAPMGAAPAAYILWDRFLRHNPRNPNWFNRDRFILSAGHASMLLYSLLYMTGYDISLDDIKDFRQWESKTPGHPEYGITPGVEVTTGPLGQGFSNGVGMAVASRFLAARFNRPNHKVIDHHIYALVSDGDLQEGISYEAASFAGHHKLSNMIYLYDDNGIQIEGSTNLVFSDNVRMRFEALNWHVVGPVDGNDIEAIDGAIREAQHETSKPSLIICRTNIAFGSPGKQDTASAHGEPLGPDEVKVTKENMDWPLEPEFLVPEQARDHMTLAIERGQKLEQDWENIMRAYEEAFPGDHMLLRQYIREELPENWDADLYDLFKDQKDPMATRGASGKVLNAIANKVLNIMGGSADLGPSNKTLIQSEGDFLPDDHASRNIRFGVREHAMAGIVNGMALHGGMIPYTGTFLVFSDYMKPPMRLAALMGLKVIYVFTHDSIGLGEDGPTHQPIEQINSLRAVPGLTVIRPADANETVHAWRAAINYKGPTALIFTRQKVNTLPDNPEAFRGGYILWEEAGDPQAIIIATGSEVHIALEAAEMLKAEDIPVRVVSLLSWEIFEKQSQAYQDKVLPPDIRIRVAVEAGATQMWRKYVGLDGDVVGIDHFGASAPYQVLYEKFGITSENVVVKVKNLLNK